MMSSVISREKLLGFLKSVLSKIPVINIIAGMSSCTHTACLLILSSDWLFCFRVVAKLHPSVAGYLLILLDVMKPCPIFISNSFYYCVKILANLIKIVSNIQQV